MFKIVYHKNCMDGVAAACVVKAALEEFRNVYFYFQELKLIPCQYGEEQELFKDINEEDVFYFVDFSLKRDLMKELASKVSIVNVLDHHKTAQKELEGIENEIGNITVIFDMNKSGATLAYDYWKDLLPVDFPDREIFEYVEDRDLWKWELDNSKEINAGLRWLVEPNDVDSFKDVAYRFKEEKNKFDYVGKIVTLHQQREVDAKVKKVKDLKLFAIDFKAINATENISELGNAICQEYNTPALIYFFTQNDEVVCSMRSTDELADVSVIAKELGGGGHRNACGFTLDIESFTELIINRVLS